MFPRLCHPDRADGKLRPASHSYLPRQEPGVLLTLLSLAALLIYTALWLVRVLSDLPFAHP